LNARFTLIIFLVFGALAAFAWTLRDRDAVQVGPNAPTPTPGPMWDFDADAVQSLEVAGPGGSVMLARVGDGWEVDGEAASDEVDGVVKNVAEPTLLRVLPEDRDPNDYGFATPAMTLTFRITDDAEVRLFRGDQVPMASDYYVRLESGGPIRIVSGFDIDRLEEWTTDPPLAPTPTPEAEAEDASTVDDEDDTDAGDGADDGEEVGDGADGGEGEGDDTGTDEDADDATSTAETGEGSGETTSTPTSTPTATATSESETELEPQPTSIPTESADGTDG